MSLSIADLKSDLPAGLLEGVTDERLTAVLAAERSQQASVVRRDAEDPAALDAALLARVRYNLETGPADQAVARLGSGSEEVRELEAPFGRRVAREVRRAIVLAGDEPSILDPAAVVVDVDAGGDAAPAPAKKAPAKKAAKKSTKPAAKKAPTKKTTAAKKAAGQQASPASNEGK